jgi:hypothetical protein
VGLWSVGKQGHFDNIEIYRNRTGDFPVQGITIPGTERNTRAGTVKVLPVPVRSGAWFIVPGTAREKMPCIFLYDQSGNPVRHLTGPRENGFYWDGRDQTGQAAPSGVYFYRLTGEQGSLTGRFIKID